MSNISEPTYALLKSKKRRIIEHHVVLDEEPVTGYAQLRNDLNDARASQDAAAISRLETLIPAAEAAAEAAVVTVKLQALGGAVYAALKASHPAKDSDHKRVQEITGNTRARAAYHAATFRPALVAACLTSPTVTVEEAEEMQTDWNEAEWDGLVTACRRVNEDSADTSSLVFSSGRTRN